MDMALACHRARHRPLRQLQRLHRCLPHAGHRGAPRVDARRCISYLTIEYAGPIPLELRPDGQPHLRLRRLPAGVPWNKFAQVSRLPDFDERKGLSGQQLVHLFAWDEPTFCA